MIAVMTYGKNFRALAAYVFRARNPAEQEAVAWTAARNLPTDDPELAVSFMSATATQSQNVKSPSYHIALTFAPQDPVDREIMEGVADRMLAGLGLADHQALYVAHRDRPHPHVHIMLNRVHPETGRVWTPWYDWRRVRQILDREEQALGLHHVPTRMTKIDDLARDVETLEHVAALGGERYRAQMEASAARARIERVERTLDRARITRTRCDRLLAAVYRDPEHAYRAFGARVELEGPAEASRLMGECPERFGALATVERARGLGLWRVPDETQARAAAPGAAVATREAFEAARASIVAVQSTAQRAERLFEGELARIYQDPAGARRAFERLAHERDPGEAVATLRERPEVLGIMRTSDLKQETPLGEQLAQAARNGVDAVQARAAAQALSRDPHVEVSLALERSGVERATGRERSIRAELERLPARAELERRLGFALSNLLPHEVRVLRATLTAPRIALVSQLSRSIRDIALGRDEEREQSGSSQPA